MSGAGAAPWRIAVVSGYPPVVERLIPQLRELGHDPVGWLISGDPGKRSLPPWRDLADRFAHSGTEVVFAADRLQVAPALRGLRPDLMLCWGFPWKLPQEALDVAHLGSVNQHPARLPRHRGPQALAWALRDGDAEFGVTWHRMDAGIDTGPILAQTAVPIADDDCTAGQVMPKLIQAALDLLPRVFARIAAGDQGDPQPADGATWAGRFGEDYASVDWGRPARVIHNQVRAWRVRFAPMRVPGPYAEIDGQRVKLLRTSLTDPGDGSRAVKCGDGYLWITESEAS